uniref:Endonuclease/exonuclease/phosphatase domain-containing protein n=3 Tax=Micrurus TaxID=8634 RepID=A0A2D4GJ12_MICCO
MGPNDQALFNQFKIHYDEDVPEEPLHSRQFKDPKANWAGLCVRQMTQRLDLCILNGSTKGNCPAEYTYRGAGKKSTVDYWIISYDLQKFLQKMEVDSRLESDHNSVILTLTLHQESLRTGSIYLPRLESQNIQIKIKWTEENAKEVTKWMLAPEIIELRTSLLNNKFEGSYLDRFET